MATHVFTGPTLSAAAALAIRPGATIQPPVAHGDLLRLDLHTDDVVVLIDGYYHQSGSVRHKEILWLLANGVAVIGCSSMGALRAAELHPFGMVGHGTVFEMYQSGSIDSDEEVAITHGEAPGYVRFSDPMVNVRFALKMAEQAGMVTAVASAFILACAQSIRYPDRSWRSITQAVCEAKPNFAAELERLNAFVVSHPALADIKAADAIDTLERLDELVSSGAQNTRAWKTSPDWKTRHLSEWITDFGGSAHSGMHVADGAVVRFQQIYSEDFVSRWRRFALRQICGALSDEELCTQAITIAARAGLTYDSLTDEQKPNGLRRLRSRSCHRRNHCYGSSLGRIGHLAGRWT